MQPFNRTLYRAALHIERVLRSTDQSPVPCEALQSAWQQLLRSLHRASRAQRQGWRAADLSLPRDLRYWASELTSAVSRVVSRFEAPRQRHPDLARSVYEDLLALEDEFEDLEVDVQEKVIAITTAPIELEGVELGRFQVRLKWPKLLEHRPYEVLALEPNPAATSGSTTHPHVQLDSLCEGEGRTAIRAALEQGRVLDFFVLVRQVLETYNPGSAYVQLSDWSGVECSDCGVTVCEEDSASCGRCDVSLCSDCSRSCSECSRNLCSSCSTVCEGCETEYCSVCLGECTACFERYCSECLTEGQCRSCLENQETSDEEDEDPSAPPPSAESGAAVHPICLGQADLLA